MGTKKKKKRKKSDTLEQTIEVNGNKVFLKRCRYYAKFSIAHYRRKAVEALGKIGIEPRYIDLQYGGGSGLRDDAWAEMTWSVNNQDHTYRCDSQQCDVDNVASIAQVIEQDVKSIRRGLKSFGQVMNQFRLDSPSGERIKTPREIIGVEENCKDFEYITFKYKQRAKEIHPDKTGDKKAMQELNEALAQLHTELRL